MSRRISSTRAGSAAIQVPAAKAMTTRMAVMMTGNQRCQARRGAGRAAKGSVVEPLTADQSMPQCGVTTLG